MIKIITYTYLHYGFGNFISFGEACLKLANNGQVSFYRGHRT